MDHHQTKKKKKTKKNKRDSASAFDKFEEKLKSEKRKEFDSFENNIDSEADDFGKNGNFAHWISPKSIKVGTTLLGVVVEVKNDFALISLPCNMKGRVKINNFSDEHRSSLITNNNSDNDIDKIDGVELSLTKCLCRGQQILCIVLDKNIKNQIDLSCCASDINNDRNLIDKLMNKSFIYGTIHSEEDHGYNITLTKKNSKNIVAFLKFNEKEKEDDNLRQSIGTGLNCVVKSIKSKDGRKIIDLNIQPNNKCVNELTLTTINQIKAGMLIEGRIEKYLDDGIGLHFLGFMYGTVDRFQVDELIDFSLKKSKKINKHKKHVAKILFVDYEKKKIGLSLCNRFKKKEIDMEKTCEILDNVVGKKFSNALVKRIDPKKGVLIHISKNDEDRDNEENFYIAYARSRISGKDDNIEVDAKYKVGQTTDCRVLGYSCIDGYLNVSLAKSVIESSLLRIEDLALGQKVQGTVLKIADFGLLIRLNDRLVALVPYKHMSDVLISDAESRFKLGQKLDLKVWDIDIVNGSKKIKLTHKRSLLDSDFPMITCYENAKEGMVTQGVVTASSAKTGVFVTFYGNVFGRIDKADLVALGLEDDPTQAYKVGTVVKVRVVKINSSDSKKQLQLSLQTSSETPRLPDNGSLVSGKIRRKTNDKCICKLENKAIASIPITQIEDKVDSNSEIDMSAIPKKFTNAMVLDQSNGILTTKQSLLAAKSNSDIPLTFEESVIGTTIVGYINNVTNAGVFVSFLGGLKALAPKPNLKDFFVSDPKEHFVIGQTVLAHIIDVRPEDERMIVSLKPSMLNIPMYMHTCFLNTLFSKKNTFENLKDICIGKNAEAIVTEIKEQKIELDLILDEKNNVSSSVKAICLKEHLTGAYSIGDKVICRILDTNDHKSGYIDVSLRKSIVNSGKEFEGKKKKVVIKAINKFIKENSGKKLKATIELMKEKYMILSYSDYIIMAPTTSFNGEIYGVSEYKVDKKLEIEILSSIDDIIIAGLHTSEKSELHKRQRSRGISMDLEPQNKKRKPQKLEIGGIIKRSKVINIGGGWINLSLNNVELGESDIDAEFSDRLHGQLHMTDIADLSREKNIEKKNMLDIYNCGDTIENLEILKFEAKSDSKGRKLTNVILSKNRSKLIEKGDLQNGQSYLTCISAVLGTGIVVAFSKSLSGFIYCTQVSRDLDVLNKLFNSKDNSDYRPGTILKVTVIDKDAELPQLSMII